jgi:hypothetical protein
VRTSEYGAGVQWPKDKKPDLFHARYLREKAAPKPLILQMRRASYGKLIAPSATSAD